MAANKNSNILDKSQDASLIPSSYVNFVNFFHYKE